MGWPAVTLEDARQCIDAACFLWGARGDEGELLGLVRVVGDGVLTFYVADVMVHPDARGRGVGDELMERLVDYLRANAAEGATIALVPLHGRESFYERHGFGAAPRHVFGEAMLWLEPLRAFLEPDAG